ncbi:MarR family transcriptional regulator [Schaalia cardiffensis]
MTRVTTRSFADTLSTMASLTAAQHSLLERIAEHETPVTVSDLAAEAELHVSSVRETLDALMGMGLVSREQLPAQGRGRPALGYSTTTPTDPAFPALMLNQMTSAILDVLRETNDDPGAIARLIGRKWANHALEATGIPDHSRFTRLPEGFTLSSHMGKIRMFLSALGFAASPLHGHPTSLVMTACPFTHPEDPDPLALELRRGLVERILERTAVDYATWTYVPDAKQPMRVVITLSERITKPLREAPMLVRFFGGAAEAAEADELEIPASSLPTTLGVLLGMLADSRPALASVLEVSTFLLNRKPADRNTPLRPGLQLDVLPPFAGG